MGTSIITYCTGGAENATERPTEAKEEVSDGYSKQKKKTNAKSKWKLYDSSIGLLNQQGDYNLSKGLESKHAEDEIFDAHLHVNDHFGDSTGPIAMFECLKECRVFGAAICMNQYIKKWGEFEVLCMFSLISMY